MASAHDTGEADLGRHLATLTALARVRSGRPGTALQAVAWWQGLARLGLTVPLAVVHDLGVLLSCRNDAVRPQVTSTQDDDALLISYEALLAVVASSQALDGLDDSFLRDEVVTVLLARLLGDVCRDAAVPADGVVPFLRYLVARQEILLARLEQLQLGPLRLAGLFRADLAAPDLVDLYQLVATPGIAAIADFSLRLLPSLLETKRQPAAQRFSVDGYSSIERRGTIDDLLPSELAHDSETFALKALSDDLLHYAHERSPEGSRRTHGILIDASASMRGVREIFGRSLALALAKKLALGGGDVWLSFFDSRLHRRIEAGALGGKDLPYFLTFRSERGRNYARVFEDLGHALAADSSRRRRELAITFITHGECHVPVATVAAVARRAALCGVFVQPSRPLALDYLGLLRRHQIVSAESLALPEHRRQRALEIVDDVAKASSRE